MFRDGFVRLIDFGFSREIKLGQEEHKKLGYGTTCFIAPEIYSETGFASEKADVYSLGVTVYNVFVSLS